jgi:hypothetical protein
MENEMGGAFSTHGRDRKCIKILVGKLEGKRTPGRPRRSLEDNIKMDFWEIVWEGVDWMHLAQERDQRQAVVNTVMKLWVP